MECIFIFLVENLESPEKHDRWKSYIILPPKNNQFTFTCVMQLEISALEMVFDCIRPTVLNKLLYA